MKLRLVSLTLALSFSLTAITASAQSFSSFDPRSMAMGGVGVAIARPDTATFFNPALLSLPRESDSFSLQAPYIGARVFDPDDFEDSLDSTQAAIDALDATIRAINNSLTADSFSNLARDTTTLNNALIDLDQDLVHFEVGAGLSGGRPDEKLGIGVFIGGRVNANGRFNYEDDQVLADLAEDATTIDNCIETPANCNNPSLNYIVLQVGTITNPINVNVTFDPNTDLTSTADIRGVLITEAGVSFSHSYNGFALGITPKYVNIETFDYRATIDDADTDSFDGDRYVRSYSNFNLDLGVAKAVSDKINVGLIVKNVIEKKYDTVQKELLSNALYDIRGGAIIIRPQARAGIAYQGDWVTLAADLDLTKNRATGFEQSSQQLGLGAEFNALGFLQLRLGYKSDFEDSDRSTASAGLGVAFLGAHVDVAISGNGDEIGGAFEFGFAF